MANATRTRTKKVPVVESVPLIVEPRTHDVERMFAEEIAMLSDLKARPRNLSLKPERFVKRTYDAHTEMIERWGGWRYHTPVIEGDYKASSENNLIGRHITNLVNNESEKDGTPYLYWISDLSKQRPKGYFPVVMPLTTSALYTTREWDADDNDSVEYATGCAVKIRRGQVCSRVVLADVRKRFKGFLDDQIPGYEGYNTERHYNWYVALYEKIFTSLGEFWRSDADTTAPVKSGFRITISCSPSDFAWLGEIERIAKTQSCFGSSSEISKYNLSITPGAFVAFFYTKAPENAGNPYTLIRPSIPDGRAWGFKVGDRVAISNFYRMKVHTMLPALRQAFEGAFGLELPAHHASNSTIISGEHAYSNSDGNYFFPADSSYKGVVDQIRDSVRIFRENNSTYDRIKCHVCEKFAPAGGICEVCDDDVCANCMPQCGCRGNRCIKHVDGYRKCVGCNTGSCNNCHDTRPMTDCAVEGCEVTHCNYCVSNAGGRKCTGCETYFCSAHLASQEMVYCNKENHGHRCRNCYCEHSMQILLDVAWRAAIIEDFRRTQERIQQDVIETNAALRSYLSKLDRVQLTPAWHDFLNERMEDCTCPSCYKIREAAIADLLEIHTTKQEVLDV